MLVASKRRAIESPPEAIGEKISKRRGPIRAEGCPGADDVAAREQAARIVGKFEELFESQAAPIQAASVVKSQAVIRIH